VLHCELITRPYPMPDGLWFSDPAEAKFGRAARITNRPSTRTTQPL
jgi:hypothetical protein